MKPEPSLTTSKVQSTEKSGFKQPNEHNEAELVKGARPQHYQE